MHRAGQVNAHDGPSCVRPEERAQPCRIDLPVRHQASFRSCRGLPDLCNADARPHRALAGTAEDDGIILSPGFEDKNIVSWATFTYPFNLTGNPAASIPVELSSEGLPVGLQAVASAHDDISLLSLGGAYERATGHEKRARPSL
ncbi:amidase family protein [Amorphus orientalis]|uniref:Amidase domain-containing protein n=1 Tax=Amorphus orientalis TaxID=649198 RepID=A0AAE3VSL5_9HYPH|nr:amidase family protein [Amorphus orientalis]MDQ0316851.1 hypothetical protein [Amorphus orientalis]